MYQEEILKAIWEQTEAIERQTKAIENQTQAFEKHARNLERVFGTGIEKKTEKIPDVTDESRKEYKKRVLAELNAVQASKRK